MPENEKKKREGTQDIDLGPLLFLLIACLLIPVAVKFHDAYVKKQRVTAEKVGEERRHKKEMEHDSNKLKLMKEEVIVSRSFKGVEREARNKLGLIKPGEVPFVVTRDKGESENIKDKKNKKDRNQVKSKKE
ncbi:MAG: hypothetical protein K8T10_00270 [Candidatus Eremiobacteraeota bacterium]|nr:hypothetical protein [Candidatus Eremiobacteraeota bacterium]